MILESLLTLVENSESMLTIMATHSDKVKH